MPAPSTANSSVAERELVIERVVDLPPEKLYKGWTDVELLKQWFAPKPWSTPFAELDVRAGGSSVITMRSPEGQDYPNSGVYLEVVPNERLVFTDAYTKAWEPSGNPFMTVILTFENLGGGRTRYTASARHWTVEAYEQHKAMGFEVGWNKCLDQLVALVSQN